MTDSADTAHHIKRSANDPSLRLEPPQIAPGLLALCVAACATGGWDTRFGAACLSLALCSALAAILLTPNGRKRFAAVGTLPWIAVGCGVFVMVWGVLQTIPSILPDHPMWREYSSNVAGGAPTLHPHAGWGELAKLLGLAAAFLIGVSAGRDGRGMSRCARMVLGAVSLYAVSAIVLHLVGLAFLGGGGGRLFAGLGSANAAALVFAVGLLLALARLLQILSSGVLQGVGVFSLADVLVRAAPLAVTALLACACALMMTASRAGVVLAMLGVLALIAGDIFDQTDNRQTRRTVLAACAGMTAVFLMFGGPVMTRLGALSLAEDPRVTIMAMHADAAMERLWFGHGLGTFGLVNNVVMTQDTTAALAPVGAAHNAYLQWVEEAGLLGAVPMFLFVALIACGVFAQAWRTSERLSQRGSAPRFIGGNRMMRVNAILLSIVLLHAFVDYAINIYAIAVGASLWLGASWANATAGRQRSGRGREPFV